MVISPNTVVQLQAEIAELRDIIEKQRITIKEQNHTVKEQARIIEEWKKGHRVRPKRRSSSASGRKKKDGSKAKKRPGRKKGHEATHRPMPDHIDRTEHRDSKDGCDCCQSAALKPTGETRERVVENVIPARVEVEKNVLYEFACCDCGKLQWSSLPPEYGPEPPLADQPMLGPGVLSMALGLRFGIGISFHKVAKYFDRHVNLKVSTSGIYQMIARAAERTKPIAEQIRQHALQSPYNHMDETSWWQDGIRLWAWVISNPDLSYFHIDPSRSHAVIEKLLCELDDEGSVINSYDGTVVSDFMGAYRTCAWMVHQYCWVHLLRDADKAAEMDPGRMTETFRDRLLSIYVDALETQATQDEGKKHGVRVRLGRLAADTKLGVHADVARLQARIDTEFHSLLTFLDHPGLPAHNNQGELDIRSLVLFRKVVFGTRSERGTSVHAHFMSLAQTAHKQGVDLGDFIIQVLAAQRSGADPPSLFN